MDYTDDCNTIINLDSASSNDISCFHHSYYRNDLMGESGSEKFSGEKYTFTSAFFDVKDENLYLSIEDTIFKFNLGANKIVLKQVLGRYKYLEDLRIYNSADTNLFYAVTGNEINIHNIKYLKYNTTFKIKVVYSIKNLKNSNDGDYVYFQNEFDRLYRINNKALLGAVNVEEQFPVSDNFSLSPNPAIDYLEISYSPSINRMVNHTVDYQDVVIYNVFGTKIPPRLTSSATPQEGNLRIDVSSLSPGIYFVKVGEKVGKFIKIDN